MLNDGGQTRHTLAYSQSLGFLRRGAPLQRGAVAVQLPEQVDGERSVCGIKEFLVDERRRFALDNGTQLDVDCAKLAVLDITDSPVHVHGETVETYQILSGHGRMLLGDAVIAVRPGTCVVIPPGTPHGVMSDDPAQPVRVLMTFTPGLAPIAHQQVRDERIVAAAASAVIAQIQAQAQIQATPR